ncbi:hypothetical protein T069G_07987 [Trichoderma breve]|uniref:Uncharacterized protein n=1 Tax=Trichoderma breve TaxID=2034170 RepID=A0A9W9E4K0_9HYPO|nr:hypothetical protein T069G_07987 [Trichoderma breve]KAJ4857090.1 hypothetical protein T069G_07987 [Trichoderma breve]
MDPLSVSYGILPMVGNSVNVYKSVRAKFKIFCHYSAEVERIRKLFGSQRDYFLNEIELVLRLVLQDQDVVKSMMKDPAHTEWHAHSLEKKLEALLERNLMSLIDIVNDINDSISTLQKAFKCFAPLEEEQKRDEQLQRKPLKDCVRKLRKRVTITFEKKNFEDQIDVLEKSNSALRRLREQVSELQKPPSYTTGKQCKRAGRLPLEFKGYRDIRRASKALHEALTAAWSSTQAPHLRHFVKLFLDAKAETDVQMEIAILCYGAQLQQTAIFQTNLTRLEVRSRTMDSIMWSSASLLSPAPEMDNSQNSRRKRPKVRFSDIGDKSGLGNIDAESLSQYSIANTSQSTIVSPDDLQLTGHFCPELLRRCSTPDMVCKAEGLGHIDSCMQEPFRHCFFPCSNNHSCGKMGLDDVMLMDEALGQSASNRLTIVGQLRLAHRLVSAVLKFNSTPWLNEVWSFRDLAFFRQGDDLTLSLQTLHFGVELIHGGPDPGESLMDVESPVSLTQSIEDVQYKHGVRNVTLYSLGAALLAIGRWERIDHNDIEGVRRLASQSCYLGPVYQELTQKVLDCDFGYGKDLKKPRLQEAIYEMVVLELESMIASLDISGEEDE